MVARSKGPGCGTEIELEFPAIPSTRVAAGPTPASVADHHLRVLVVDYNDDARAMLADAVADSGHEVVIAQDGSSALLAADRVDPELVLLDIGLPDIDGYEVARRLRVAHPRAALVAVTGYGKQQDRERALAAGFDALLVKPIDLEQVASVLMHAAAAAAQARAPSGEASTTLLRS